MARESDVTFAGAQAAVKVFMAEAVACIAPEATLYEVSEKLSAVEVGALLVGTPEDVKGVCSERDVVHALGKGLDPARTAVADIASKKVIRCSSTASVGTVARQMMEEYVRHVLVTEQGRVVGIVSARDVLGAFASA